METNVESVAISDPGERNREIHTWGDRLVVNLANIAAWIFPLLVIAIVTQVVIRKAGFNQAWLDDAQWWMYGFAVMVGFGYAITTNSHVRVDIFHQSFSEKRKARVEVFAIGWLLLPFLLIMTDILIHYAWSSVVAGEGSDSPNGLHKLYLLKSSLPLLFLMAVIAACSALYRNLCKLRKPALWNLIIATIPAAWFFAERFCFYLSWWYTRLTNPDMKSRMIPKQPLLENSIWVGLGLLVVVFIISFGLSRRKQSQA